MRFVAALSIALLLALALPVRAQQSASFHTDESVLNLAGHPQDGGILGSPSYRVRLDSLGEAVVRSGLSSASRRRWPSRASSASPCFRLRPA